MSEQEMCVSLWRRLTQLALLIAAATIVVRSQTPFAGPPPATVVSSLGSRPAIGGGESSLPGVPVTGTDPSRFSPYASDLLMEMSEARREKLALYFSAQFQIKNVADTNRLLRLARELNADSEKAGTLPTAAEIRKVEEIEKLARRVRERLTTP